MIFLCIPAVVLFFMLGGQIQKLFRPIGITLSIATMYLICTKDAPLFVIPTLLYGGILTIGYGENSKLMKWLKTEQKVRIIYGILLALPVILSISLTQRWEALLSIPFVVASNMLRIGSIGKIGKYDILPTDIVRGLAVGLAMSWALLGA